MWQRMEPLPHLAGTMHQARDRCQGENICIPLGRLGTLDDIAM